MAKESSFDIVSEPDMAEVANAVDQTRREAAQRYDFRGQDVAVSFDPRAGTIVLEAPAGMTLEALERLLLERMARRGVSLRFLDIPAEPELLSHGRGRKAVVLRRGLGPDKAKEIQRAVRALGLKVEAQVQGDAVRVAGKSKDDLQAVIRALRGQDFGVELTFTNYR
ncbi:MAG: YajQ family cyclic di-GMP-binding protein [Firmicutes bacterium]|nr:YajQ family cyclic di-GMP-binding protein [Bacillota bacterium]